MWGFMSGLLGGDAAKPESPKHSEAEAPPSAQKGESAAESAPGEAPAKAESTPESAPVEAPSKASEPAAGAQASEPAATTEEAPAQQSDGKDKQAANKPGRNLCIKNLGVDMTQEKLRALFEPFGTIQQIHVKTKREDGTCRGFAFVTLGTVEEAAKAITELDKKVVDGQEIAVTLVNQKGQDYKVGAEEKGKSKGKGKKGEKGPTDKGKGKGRGKKGAQTTQSDYVPPYAYGMQPSYGSYGQYGYQMYPDMHQQYYQSYQMPQAYAMQNYSQFAQWYQEQMKGVEAATTSQEAAPAPAPPETQFVGVLKSLSSRNGYGFLDWPWNQSTKTYIHDKTKEPRDVYVSAETLPAGGHEIGTKLKFTVTLNSKGHPMAKTCSLASAADP